MDTQKLNELVTQGYLRAQAHPYLPYTIYNYTEKTNYENAWNEYTLTCRGLILEDDGTIVSRPFPKFFNYGQTGAPTIDADAEVVVTDKLDGSLGILYPGLGGPAVASRGSFTSDQAEHATAILRERYAEYATEFISEGVTALFEIIYPANRIVCDYGDMDDLILLGGVENATGRTLHPYEMGWAALSAKTFEYATFAEALAAEPRPGAEGLVVYVKSTGDRVKIKQEDYIRLHKIVTGLNARAVWEVLSSGADLDAFVASLPDEFHDWTRDVARQLTADVANAERKAHIAFTKVLDELDPGFTRKDFALAAQSTGNPAILFSLLDGKRITPRLWRDARPDAGWTPSGRVLTEVDA
jgi:RNA ligase